MYAFPSKHEVGTAHASTFKQPKEFNAPKMEIFKQHKNKKCWVDFEIFSLDGKLFWNIMENMSFLSSVYIRFVLKILEKSSMLASRDGISMYISWENNGNTENVETWKFFSEIRKMMNLALLPFWTYFVWSLVKVFVLEGRGLESLFECWDI